MKEVIAVIIVALLLVLSITVSRAIVAANIEKSSHEEVREVEVRGHTVFVWRGCSSGYSVHIPTECRHIKCQGVRINWDKKSD